jgi:hypothetical protein
MTSSATTKPKTTVYDEATACPICLPARKKLPLFIAGKAHPEEQGYKPPFFLVQERNLPLRFLSFCID